MIFLCSIFQEFVTVRDFVERQRVSELKKAAEAAAASSAAQAAELRAEQRAESGLPPMENKAQRRRSTAHHLNQHGQGEAQAQGQEDGKHGKQQGHSALHRNRSMVTKSSAAIDGGAADGHGDEASLSETHYPGQRASNSTSNASSGAHSPKQEGLQQPDTSSSSTGSHSPLNSEESGASPIVKRTRILQRRKSSIM